MTARSSCFVVLGVAAVLFAVPAQSRDWTQKIDFQDCEQLEESSGYYWYSSGDTIGVKPENTDYTKTSTTRLKCVIRFPGFASIAMVLAFDDSTWDAVPDRGGAGGDRQIIIRDYFGDEMIPLDDWPRWKKQIENPAFSKVGPASWTYLFDRPTTQITLTLRATDSWSDRQIAWTITNLNIHVLEADQTAVTPSLFYDTRWCRLLH